MNDQSMVEVTQMFLQCSDGVLLSTVSAMHVCVCVCVCVCVWCACVCVEQLHNLEIEHLRMKFNVDVVQHALYPPQKTKQKK